MKTKLLDILVCPSCLPEEFPLAAKILRQESDDIIEGSFFCQGCGKHFSIEKGVAFLDPGITRPSPSDLKYETPGVLSSYVWGHFGDLWGDDQASDAYTQWADLMSFKKGFSLDIGTGVGRFCFEMSKKSDFAVGLDKSVSFVQTARELMTKGKKEIHLTEEGFLVQKAAVEIAGDWNPDRMEFIVADALALPFRTGTFSSVASLNLIDKLPFPLAHLAEMNRVALAKGAQFLFSDPFSWSEEVSKKENWLGGTMDGIFPGRGLDNVIALVQGEKGGLSPSWQIEQKGHVWWKLRTHSNHFEQIRSLFVKAHR